MRERQYRSARSARLLQESRERVVQQQEEERERFIVRQEQSTQRTEAAERHRKAVIRERSAELATKKVEQAAVRERKAQLYEERLAAFAVKKAAKEASAKKHMKKAAAEKVAKFKIHRAIEARQQVRSSTPPMHRPDLRADKRVHHSPSSLERKCITCQPHRSSGLLMGASGAVAAICEGASRGSGCRGPCSGC